jgi:hypothetical protein
VLHELLIRAVVRQVAESDHGEKRRDCPYERNFAEPDYHHDFPVVRDYVVARKARSSSERVTVGCRFLMIEIIDNNQAVYRRGSGEQADAAARANTIMRRAATPAPAMSPAKCRSSGCDTIA